MLNSPNPHEMGCVALTRKLESRGKLTIILAEDVVELLEKFSSQNKKLGIHGLAAGFHDLDALLSQAGKSHAYEKIDASEGEVNVNAKIRTGSYDGILMVGPHEEWDWLSTIRSVAFSGDYQGELFIAGPERKSSIKTPFENPLPILVYCFPCSGTMRFWPQIYHILQECRFTQAGIRDQLVNRQYQFLRGHDLPFSIAQHEQEQLTRWSASGLDYYEFANLHYPINLANIRGTGCRVVVLMRDPRDILTSYYYHTIGESNISVEDRLIYLMNGYRRRLDCNCYSLVWPNIRDLCNSFATAVTDPEFIVVRFEDLHTNEIGTLKQLMSQLGLYPHPLLNMGENFFADAALKGSIEYQTGGARKRGGGYKTVYGGPGHGSTSRNGVVGDWKELFTPKAIEHFKQMTGDALVKLGYEKNTDW